MSRERAPTIGSPSRVIAAVAQGSASSSPAGVELQVHVVRLVIDAESTGGVSTHGLQVALQAALARRFGAGAASIPEHLHGVRAADAVAAAVMARVQPRLPAVDNGIRQGHGQEASS